MRRLLPHRSDGHGGTPRRPSRRGSRRSGSGEQTADRAAGAAQRPRTAASRPQRPKIRIRVVGEDMTTSGIWTDRGQSDLLSSLAVSVPNTRGSCTSRCCGSCESRKPRISATAPAKALAPQGPRTRPPRLSPTGLRQLGGCRFRSRCVWLPGLDAFRNVSVSRASDLGDGLDANTSAAAVSIIYPDEPTSRTSVLRRPRHTPGAGPIGFMNDQRCPSRSRAEYSR